MKKTILLLVILLFPFVVYSKEITSDSTITLEGSLISSKVLDDSDSTYISVTKNQIVKITSSNNIKGLYILYELNGGKGTISNNEITTSFGENEFLHDYINVEGLIGVSNTITLKYSTDVKITDIHVIGEGEIPSFVEMWNPPAEKADLLLISTHSDDEQLFFLGLLPYYVAKGANVQVVYFTNHKDNKVRYHEQLHGLYTVGVRNYPIVGPIPDEWSTTLSAALKNMKSHNISENSAMAFEVEMIRRFKPLVIVGHDEKGEYGHGQHILSTYLLERAIDYANDSTYDKDSYEKYGVWSTKKVYIHLYKKNKITMNYDEPLEYFNGRTAYEMSKLGFKKHNSQQNTWFRPWINGENNELTKAADIKTYSPCEYGLLRSLVGEDKNKNDMFENLSFYKDIVDEDEYFNKASVATIKEQPMENDEKKVSTKQIVALTIIILSGIGLLILIKKL